jgi:TolB-like protein/Tfp pilus assembly protein PilF
MPRIYRFGPFCLDTGRRLFHREGELIPLAPKTLDTLLALVERSGEVLDKEDLLNKVWPDSFVEEGSLAQNISILRRILGEATDGQQYIQTIPKRGYRFAVHCRSQPSPDSFHNAPGVADVPSIAVLPFANMSGDSDQEYFSDGLAEEIINALAQIPGLKVTARTSAFAFRGKEQDITKIAEALRVRTILEGSVRRAGSSLRITVQLIDAADGCHIWGQRYDRELTDVFQVQEEIAAQITDALQIKLAGRVTARRYQPNLRAYEAFLKGRHALSKITRDSAARAKKFLEQAIALDPEYSEAYAELGQYYFLLGAFGAYSTSETMAATRAQAQKALELNPANPRVHALLCTVAGAFDYDWKEAERQYRLALASDPVPFSVRGRCAISYLLPLGRFQEAITQFERDLEQDPLSVASRAFLARTLLAAGLYDRALAEAQTCLEIDENHWLPLSVMSLICVQLGHIEEALQAAEKCVRAVPWRSSVVGLLGGILAQFGEADRLDGLVAKLREMAPIGFFWYHLLRSEIDAAADYYAKMIEQRDPEATHLAAGRFLQPLRSSPRWPALAKMMNLSPEDPAVDPVLGP